jgi:hypothetical protein
MAQQLKLRVLQKTLHSANAEQYWNAIRVPDSTPQFINDLQYYDAPPACVFFTLCVRISLNPSLLYDKTRYEKRENPPGDFPALLMRQHRFDKCWNMPFPYALKSNNEDKNGEILNKTVGFAAAEAGTALRNSSFVIRHSAVQ